MPAVRADAFRAPELSPAEKAALKRDFAPCVSKLKGPYTENFCVCRKSGEKRPVMDKSGRITSPCGTDDLFCAAFRAPWAESLGKQRMWIANIFSRDLWLWDSFPDHHDLVRGYILEKYFVETNPKHKLAELRAYGGLSGSEYEVGASTAFFERYLGSKDFDPAKHFPLAYELQRRFFLRDDIGQIQNVRNMAVRVQSADAKFKPLRDAIHNQISAGLIPKIAAFRDQLPAGGAERRQVEQIIDEIQKLTALDESALRTQLADISGDREKLAALVPDAKTDPVEAIARLSELMVLARETVAARRAPVADQRKLIDLDITAAAVLQHRGNALLDAKPALSAKQYIDLLRALTDAAYGAGLLVGREHEAAETALQTLAAEPRQSRQEFARRLKQAERVVEWAQANAVVSYGEVWAPWTFLLPQVASIGDDILRGSPLLLYAQVARRLDDYAAGKAALHHDFFGAEVSTDVRALNAGLAFGRLRVAPKDGVYTRDEIVALPETPADLEPAAGILTQGEGNILSHVQLLARALGIPNVVLGPSAFARLRPHDGEMVFLIATPGGRVIIKQASAMSDAERRVYDEYTRNDSRTGSGAFGAGDQKLHIDPSRIDLSRKLPIDLNEVRRSDSGKLSGPKGAFLGELKHLFPEHVARGIVVPFGAYHQHYENAPVAVPAALKSAGIASPGERLPEFVERTYKEFFGKLIPAHTPERELSAWIAPRLEIIRNSIQEAPLAPELRQAIRDGLDRNGLLDPKDRTRSVGCFVRSDTNVEDLDNFNGAGLNLTIFNLVSLDDIERGLKKVWASPFELRSFSWRQTLIDQPLWVLPSVVILESVANEKSGVLVTADVANGDPSKMTVATSEGVGGAVDGTSAETLLWSPQSVEIVTLFKSPWRNALQPSGGSKVVASTGRDHVLEPDELKQIIDAGRQIGEKLEPARDPAGKPRPWDIEFGFREGKLWLFQSRPFIGNDNLKNVPALTALEGPTATANAKDTLSLEEILR